MDKELIGRIVEQIRSEPHRFDMSDWFQPVDDTDDGWDEHTAWEAGELDTEECGTVCCIAGWAITLHLEKQLGRWPTGRDVSRAAPDLYSTKAMELLGLNNDALFFRSMWPGWAQDLQLNMTREQEAELVARLLELYAKLEDIDEAWEELRFLLELEKVEAEARDE